MKVIAFLILASFAQGAQAGWLARVLPQTHSYSPGRVIINFSSDPGEGVATFGEALSELAKTGHAQRLDLITLHGLLQHSPPFEREIAAVVQSSAPREWAEATKSAGNMHNPKVVALGPLFDRAVLAAPTVRTLSRDLERVGLRIAEASHEKLMIVGEGNDRHLDCFFVYLTVKPIAAGRSL